MNCKNCGREAKKGDKFCTFCGQVLDQERMEGEETVIYRIVEMPENPLYTKKEDLQWTAQQEVVEVVEEKKKKRGFFRRLLGGILLIAISIIVIIVLLSVFASFNFF